MDRSQGIMLSEINQTERQILYKLSYMWNLDKTKARLIDTENSMVVVRGDGWCVNRLVSRFKEEIHYSCLRAGRREGCRRVSGLLVHPPVILQKLRSREGAWLAWGSPNKG